MNLRDKVLDLYDHLKQCIDDGSIQDAYVLDAKNVDGVDSIDVLLVPNIPAEHVTIDFVISNIETTLNSDGDNFALSESYSVI